jgi:hypothetical protein
LFHERRLAGSLGRRLALQQHLAMFTVLIGLSAAAMA